MADKYIKLQVQDTNEVLNIKVSHFNLKERTSSYTSQTVDITEYSVDYLPLLLRYQGKSLYLLDNNGERTNNYITIKNWNGSGGTDKPSQYFSSFSNEKEFFGVTANSNWGDNSVDNLINFLSEFVLRYTVNSIRTSTGVSYESTKTLLKYNYYNKCNEMGFQGTFTNNMGCGCGFWYNEKTNLLVIGGVYFFRNNFTLIFDQTYTNQYATPPFVVNCGTSSERHGSTPNEWYSFNFGRVLNGASYYTGYLVYKVLYDDILAIEHSPLSSTYSNENGMMYFMGNVEPQGGGGATYPWEPSEDEPNDGTGLEDSDPIDPDPLRQISLLGMVNVWRITSAQSQALHDYLWDDSLIANIGSFIGNNPKQAILGFNYLPFTATGEAKNIKIGNVETNIGAVAVSDMFHEVDCGSVKITNVYGNFLDRNPYVHILLYLPYIGMVTLDPDLCVGKTLSVKYRIDVLSGGIVAYVHNGEIIVDTWSGNCSTQVPWSTEDKAQMIKNTIASAVGTIGQGAIGNVGGAIAEGGNMLASATNLLLDKVRPVAHGGYSGNTGALLNYKPYILVYRAKPNIAQSHGSEFGFCSNVTKTIGSCNGFTVVTECKLNFSCTNEEKEKIYSELRNGIII